MSVLNKCKDCGQEVLAGTCMDLQMHLSAGLSKHTDTPILLKKKQTDKKKSSSPA